MSDDITEQQPKTLPYRRPAGNISVSVGMLLMRRRSAATSRQSRIGQLLRAPVVALERRLEEAGQTAAVRRLAPISHGGPRRRRSA